MNKNPFVPAPGYPAPQPPLPPGPPPPQPGQAEYAAWWSAQQPHAQQGAAQYNPQWTAPQPARPPHEQSALYANYGYGNAQSQWQRQQQQQHQPYQPGQPYGAPPTAPQPPAQPGYNPYQPAAGYPQQYVPQAPIVAAPPQPMAQPVFQAPPQPQQPYFNPHMQPQAPQQPRMHQPPAKRQRFDGPNVNRPPNVGQHPLPPQPQFQPSIAPVAAGGSFSAPTGNRGAPPSGPSGMMNAGRGGGPAGRGGAQGGRGRGGGSFTNNRGGLPGRGRGGSVYLGPGNANRGGGPAAQQPGSLRGHASRNNFGGGARRGGASFNAGGGFQRGSSFRNRDSSNRAGNRHDGMPPTGPSFGNKDSSTNASFSNKKDENRRTLTDFKIVGLSIPELGWSWGVVPQAESADVNVKEEASDAPAAVKEEPVDDKAALSADVKDAHSELKPDVSEKVEQKAEAEPSSPSDSKPAPEAVDPVAAPRYGADANGTNPPPSRMRIYFHTPVTADDSRPIPHTAAPSYEANRKGKRKKLEDDDGDLEEGRAPPPPPQMSVLNEDRASVAASATTDTVSEDWLMAAIVEGEDGAGTHDGDGDGPETQIADDVHDDDLDAEGEVETLMDGDHLDDDDIDMGGNTSAQAEGQPTSENPLQVPVPEPLVSAPSHDDLPTGAAVTDGGPAPVDAAVSSLPTDVKEGENHSASEPASTHNEMDNSNPKPETLFDASASVDTAAPLENSATTDAQAQEPKTNGKAKSLEQVSAEPTLLAEAHEVEEATQLEDAVVIEHDLMARTESGQEQPEEATDGQDHLPEPPLSPSSNIHEDGSGQSPLKTKGPATPSANRLSISYAAGSRRLVVDAESVQSLKLYRHEGRAEVAIDLSKDNGNGLKGILVEGLSDTKSYVPIPGILDSSTEADETVPPFIKLVLPTSIQLLVHLDTVRPLSEPKWTKTGDLQEWLKSMFGRMFWVAGDAAEGWEKKIQVVDPDPPPTIWTFLDGWASNSPVGSLTERQRFVKTHMSEIDNVLEILLRLVRGERATPSGHNQPQISVPSLSGALLTALTPGSAHAAQQTHVSLAVLAIFRQTVEYAKKALGDDKGKAEAEGKVGDIIRCLPSHLIYKSLDGIFKEWKMEKKRG